MKPENLQKHVFSTYTHLRIGMITIAFLFPLLLVVGGLWHGVEWQDSMSAYYHATVGATAPPMRVWFIGLLYALGVFLFLYKGFSKLENWCLSFAGIFAVGVGLGRKVRDTGDLFRAGGQSPWWASGLSGFMTMFSAGTFVVWGGIAYRLGIVAVSINLMYGIAALLVGWFVAGRWKRLGIGTPAEFIEFGEVYFSTVNPGIVKGWHLHREMTLNYTCPHGRILLVLYDERPESPTRGEVQTVDLAHDEHRLVQVPPGVWNAFRGMASHPSIVCNCATLPHDPDEIVRIDFDSDRIPWTWDRED